MSGELIQMGRHIKGMTIGADRVEAEVVGGENDNVWSIVLGTERRRRDRYAASNCDANLMTIHQLLDR